MVGKDDLGPGTFEDLKEHFDNMNPHEAHELGYRRGYSDGFVQAINAFSKAGKEPRYHQLWDFWERTLIQWVKGDLTKMIPPPSIPAPKK